jgi:acyl dehydratase
MNIGDAEMSVLTHGEINDQGLDRVRGLINHEMRVSYRFNREVTWDGVRHFAWGVGDDNPLWLDPAYAATTDYHGAVAPPSYLYTIHPTFVQIGFAGVHGFHANTNWNLFKPVMIGQRPSSTTWLADVVEKVGRMGGNQVLVYFRTVYYDENDEVLADVLTSSMRVQRNKARDKDKHADWEMTRWSPEDIAPLEAAQLAETPRGAEPRYWEDVKVGEELEPVAKGPLTLTDMIAWYVGSQPIYCPAHELALKQFQHKPMFYYRNTLTGALEPGIRVHEDVDAARAAGVPAPYDLGVQRHQWLFHLLTNWVGDTGFVVECNAQYRDFNFFGDVQSLGGRVREVWKDPETGEGRVGLDVWSRNQHGADTMPGTAVVALPSRDADTSPITRRLGLSIKREEYLARVVPDLVRTS